MPVHAEPSGGVAEVTDITAPGSKKGVAMPGSKPESPKTVYSVISVTSHKLAREGTLESPCG